MLRLRTMFAWMLVLLGSVAIISAQTNCVALVTDALTAVGDNCDTLGRNEACYGYNQVEAQFLNDVEDDFFMQVADRSPVADLATLRTAPLDFENDVWGVAVMGIQADLPNTLPGQNVTFVLFGDTEIENSVEPDEAFEPSAGVTVSVSVAAGANIRSGPGTDFNVIGGAAVDAELQADGLSVDGDWLRVVYRDRPAWVSTSVVTGDADELADLPMLTPDLRTPMQAFYLRTGIGTIGCEGLPEDALLIQGPEEVEITLTVNGADVQIGSSGVLRIIEINGEFFLENIVFDGVFTWGDVEVRRGQRTILCLSDEDNLGLDGDGNDREVTCDASPAESVPADELQELWCNLEQVPTNLLNYGLDVPCEDDVPATATGGSNAPATTSQLDDVDCSAFFVPQQTIIATNFILDWSDVPGANSYVVAIFDQNGVELQTFPTSTSSLPTNGGIWPPAGYVDVRAYRDGQYACFARLNFNRLPDPNPNPENVTNNNGTATGGATGFTAAQVGCDPATGVQITWSNAPVPSVTVSWLDTFNAPRTVTLSNTSGSGSISNPFVPGVPNNVYNAIEIQSGPDVIGLGSCT